MIPYYSLRLWSIVVVSAQAIAGHEASQKSPDVTQGRTDDDHDGCTSGQLVYSVVSVHETGGEVQNELIGPRPSVHEGLMTLLAILYYHLDRSAISRIIRTIQMFLAGVYRTN